MSYSTDDTICAIGTAAGGAARGMVRISGPDAIVVAGRVFRPDDGQAIEGIQVPTALRGKLQLDRAGAKAGAGGPLPYLKSADVSVVPCDLFMWPTQRSYTREPVAELHTIGSTPVLEAALAATCRLGARLAEPGEFTLRAFLAGRLDLTQAEAVLGVIDARDADQLGAALTQLAGGLARPLQSLRENLLQLLAELEAGLDFIEDDIRFISQAEVIERLEAAGVLLDEVAQQMQSRHTSLVLKQVALVGAPNAGKSSLFNALVNKYGCSDSPRGVVAHAALVSPVRGTTRDYLTAVISIGDRRFQIVDTAGVDADAIANDLSLIEASAQSLAAERRERAAVGAVCIPAHELSANGGDRIRDALKLAGSDLIVVTKSDLAPVDFKLPREFGVPVVVTSSRTGDGLGELVAALGQQMYGDESENRGPIVAATAERCRESIYMARAAVDRAASIAATDAGDELIATELRVALAELGKVVGAVYTEDLLDRIFKTFCIGK